MNRPVNISELVNNEDVTTRDNGTTDMISNEVATQILNDILCSVVSAPGLPCPRENEQTHVNSINVASDIVNDVFLSAVRQTDLASNISTVDFIHQLNRLLQKLPLYLRCKLPALHCGTRSDFTQTLTFSLNKDHLDYKPIQPQLRNLLAQHPLVAKYPDREFYVRLQDRRPVTFDESNCTPDFRRKLSTAFSYLKAVRETRRNSPGATLDFFFTFHFPVQEGPFFEISHFLNTILREHPLSSQYRDSTSKFLFAIRLPPLPPPKRKPVPFIYKPRKAQTPSAPNAASDALQNSSEEPHICNPRKKAKLGTQTNSPSTSHPTTDGTKERKPSETTPTTDHNTARPVPDNSPPVIEPLPTAPRSKETKKSSKMPPRATGTRGSSSTQRGRGGRGRGRGASSSSTTNRPADALTTSEPISIIDFIRKHELTHPQTRGELVAEAGRIGTNCNIEFDAAAILLLMSNMAKIPKVVDLLTHFRRLRVFNIWNFADLRDEYRFDVSLLTRLVLPRSQLRKNFAIEYTLHHYDDNARHELLWAYLTLQYMCVCTCLAIPTGDIPTNRSITTNHIIEALKTCLGSTFNTPIHAEAENRGMRQDIVMAWNMGTQVFKMWLNDVTCYRSRELQPPPPLGRLYKIEHIRPFYLNLVSVMLYELGAHLYLRCNFRKFSDKPGTDEYTTATLPYMRQLYEHITTKLGVNNETMKSVPHTRFTVQYYEYHARVIDAAFSQTLADVYMCPITYYFFDRSRYSLRSDWARSHVQDDYRRRNISVTTQWETVNSYDEYAILNRHYFDVIPEVRSGLPHFFLWSQGRPADGPDERYNAPLQIYEPPERVSEAVPIQQEDRLNENTVPGWLGSGCFTPYKFYKPHDDFTGGYYPVTEENFNDDKDDSDLEFEVYQPDQRVLQANYEQYDIGDMLEDFYTEICNWIIEPRFRDYFGHINSTTRANTAWVKYFLANRGKALQQDLTTIPTIDMYRSHITSFICLHIRSQIRDELITDCLFAPLRGNADEAQRFLNDAIHNDPERTEFKRLLVDRVSASRDMYHINTSSNDPHVIEHLVPVLKGLTACLGFFEYNANGRNIRSPLVIFVIRSTALRGLDLERQGITGDIQELTLRLSFSKHPMHKAHFQPNAQHFLYFLPIKSLGSYLRMFRAAYGVHNLPQWIRNQMFGPDAVDMVCTAAKNTAPVTRSTLTAADTRQPVPSVNNAVRNLVNTEVNAGSLRYLRRCLNHDDTRLDASHFNSCIQVMRVIGEAEPNSQGMCMVQGPPGTGKTNNIVFLIGALIHHSAFGHPEAHQRNVLKAEDGLRRCSNRRNALKILVVTSTNQAADNLLGRLHDGIPNGAEPRIFPQTCRVTRWDYELPNDLREYNVREKSVLFDADHETRNNPSLRARRMFAEECILFVTTLSSSGSAAFKELQQSCDVILHDEAANSSEAETLVALVAANTTNGPGRLFYIGVGDQKQLPAYSSVDSMLQKEGIYTAEKVKSLKMSLFERLVNAQRVTHTFLNAQYRMHSTISHITSPPFYNCLFENPLPADRFEVTYNDYANTDNAFHPMVFVDHRDMRVEERRDGTGYVNDFELQCVGYILSRLLPFAPDGQLDNRIAIIAPYQAMVTQLRTVINNHPLLPTLQSRTKLNIKVGTVDSMQGSQRSVVITCLTRSNDIRQTGFTKIFQRLNVSVSRARFLNIIIADMPTFKDVEPVHSIYKACHRQQEASAVYVPERLNTPANGYPFRLKPTAPVNTPTTRSASEAQASSLSSGSSSINPPTLNEATVDFNFSGLF